MGCVERSETQHEPGPIDRRSYADFIYSWLQKGTYRVERRDLEKIFELGKDVPHNIQRLCYNLWELARESHEITPHLIEKLPGVIAQQDSPHFEVLWQAASQQQRTLLMALSREPDAKPFSRKFQLTYGIGPSSSIKTSLDSLTKKGLLFKTLKGAYRFSDTFMPYWISDLKRTEK